MFNALTPHVAVKHELSGCVAVLAVQIHGSKYDVTTSIPVDFIGYFVAYRAPCNRSVKELQMFRVPTLVGTIRSETLKCWEHENGRTKALR